MSEAIFLTVLNLIISSSVLLFIVWDHLKDDRQLTRQVQEFYNDIEMLIFTSIQAKYYSAIEKKEVEVPDEKTLNRTLNRTKNRDIIQNSYLKTKIQQNFEKYATYLGLTFEDQSKSYLNNTIYMLSSNGLLKKRDFDNNSINEIISSYIDIREDEIIEIVKFLTSLRFYWNKNYKKFIFRTHLIPKLDYRSLLGSSVPLEKTKKRGKLLARNINKS